MGVTEPGDQPTRRAVVAAGRAILLAGCTGGPGSSRADTAAVATTGMGARRGRAYAGLVAIEIDRAYPIAGTPGNLQVVAHSPVAQYQKPDTHSDITYYTAASGAGVVAVGSMAWCVALMGAGSRRHIDKPAAAFARTVTANLLREMAEGSLGRRHAARGNLESIGASPSTRTGRQRGG